MTKARTTVPTRHCLFNGFLLFAISIATAGFLEPASGQAPTKPGAPASEQGLIRRRPPKPVDDFEVDLDPADKKPDGWYNDRDALLVSPGHSGQYCLRLVNDKPGRPARISQGFGVDGQKFKALRLGAWVRVKEVISGEHQGEDPSLLFDFLDARLLTACRSMVRPLNDVTVGENRWFYISKIMPVQTSVVDCIMTVGLMGATGQFEIDQMELELIPRESPPITNLVPNPDFLNGDWKPESWTIEGSAKRVTDGYKSPTAMEIGRGMGRTLTSLGRNVNDLQKLSVSMMARSQGLRPSGGALASLYFVDERGRALPNRASQGMIRFSGSSSWTLREAVVDVPSGAIGAVLQLEKVDVAGSLTFDQVNVADANDPKAAEWTPRNVMLTDDADGWPEYQSFSAIESGSVLDTTQWGLNLPKGRLSVKNGHFVDAESNQARLWGVSLMATAGFPEEAKAASIADRLHKLGVNVVRFGDLDIASGPGRSLIDDVRDDTQGLDPVSWARMTNFQTELVRRGIYYSMEMQAHRRFREGDGIKDVRKMPAGGGPAAVFDPQLTTIITDLSKTILSEPIAADGKTMIDDDHLAWVTQMGEISLMDLASPATSLTELQNSVLNDLQKAQKASSKTKALIEIEKKRLSQWAQELKASGLKSPIAGVGHWRRDSEWNEAFASPGLGLIEDRNYWPYAPWLQPEYRSAIFDSAKSFGNISSSKRQKEMAYVMAQWCTQSQGAWALPSEAVDILLGAYSARVLDFDGLLRRGLSVHPEAWGESATGTGGDRNIFVLAESLSGMPQMLAMMPHVASILRRGRDLAKPAPVKPVTKSRSKINLPEIVEIPGWNPAEGTLRLETPYTAGLAGRIMPSGELDPKFGPLELESQIPFGVIVASSATQETLSKSSRILVTLMGKAIPTGLRYADNWQKEVTDPGRPPLRLEPVKGKFLWNGPGSIKAYQVDNTGKRGPELTVKTENGKQVVSLDIANGGPHVEILVNR